MAFPTLYRHFLDEPGAKKKNDGLNDVQLATSRDGIHWQRFRGSHIPLGLKDSPDSGMINYNQRSLVSDRDEICQYYLGTPFSHAVHIKKNDKSFRGMTVQRLDGFVSVDAAYGGGELTTPLIVFDGNRIELNVNTTAVGDARVEILDKDGKPIQGFSLEDADLIQGNFIRKTVTWDGDNDVSVLKGKPIRLRFVMRGTKLFAFQFVKDKPQQAKE